MLIELWERLRGYDKWVETDAIISSADMEEIKHTTRSGGTYSTYASGDVLSWTDQTGERQYADFKVSDSSPLYQLVGGESVRIRYNPADPHQYYFSALLRARFVAAGRKMLVVVGLLVLLGYCVVFQVIAILERH
jgi:hypothetical protein